MIITIKNNSTADYIAAVAVGLMAIGAVFVFSADVNINQELDLHRFYDFPAMRQIMFFPLAVLIMFTVSCIDYRRFCPASNWLKTPVTYLLILSIALLILVLHPKFGAQINYARRWFVIHLGPVRISFQPSELAKWTVIFFLAGFCVKFRDNLKLYWKCFVPACLIIAVIVGLVVIEDFGTAAFIALLSFLILFAGGAKFWHLLTPIPFVATAFFFAIISSESRVGRIKAFFDPEANASGTAYQATQSLIAMGSGGFWGKGLGRGICKYQHLPEDTTDFIFAIIGEELGFIGTATVIGLFVIFIWLGILVVMRCKDRFGRLLAGGIVLAIAIQAALNIGVVTVVLPTKGIPLPFVSAGGTSLLFCAAAVGVLLNIAKDNANEPMLNVEPDEQPLIITQSNTKPSGDN